MDGNKAFIDQPAGTILGVYFDVPTLSWSLDSRKIDNYIASLDKVKTAYKVSLKSLQSVNGIINTITTHCPAMKFYRTPIIDDIKVATVVGHAIFISKATKSILTVWQKLLHDLREGFPIPDRNFNPVYKFKFITDAAGIAAGKSPEFHIGVGAVGVLEVDSPDYWFVSQAVWPVNFITSTYDEKGAFIGNKSTTLEILGWFPPLYHNRKSLNNAAVKIFVDNSASMHAFNAGRCRLDAWASFLISSLAFVLMYKQCYLDIQHCPRLSTDGATLADALTRADRKGKAAVADLQLPLHEGWPPTLLTWMDKPYFDDRFQWDLLTDFLS